MPCKTWIQHGVRAGVPAAVRYTESQVFVRELLKDFTGIPVGGLVKFEPETDFSLIGSHVLEIQKRKRRELESAAFHKTVINETVGSKIKAEITGFGTVAGPDYFRGWFAGSDLGITISQDYKHARISASSWSGVAIGESS